MKKSYVKPIMESEAFVANEYVAACWDVWCWHVENGSADSQHDNFNHVTVQAGTGDVACEKAGAHKGNSSHRGENNSEMYYHHYNQWGFYQWQCEVYAKEITGGEHPNAS